VADVELDKKSFEEIMDKSIRDKADEIFAKSQQNLIDNNSIATGFLLKNANVNKMAEAHYQIVYSMPYAENVEFGSEPHFPAIEPLIQWVRLKLKVSSPVQARQIAFSIAKNIAQHGVAPRPYLRPALEQSR